MWITSSKQAGCCSSTVVASIWKVLSRSISTGATRWPGPSPLAAHAQQSAERQRERAQPSRAEMAIISGQATVPGRVPEAVTLPYPVGIINALPKYFMRASWMGYSVGEWDGDEFVVARRSHP